MSHFGDDLQDSTPPPKKSSGTKVLLIVLAIAGGVMLLACGGCVAGLFWIGSNAMSTDPAKVQRTADEIAQVERPAGYDPMFSMNMFGMKVAAFGDQEQGEGKMLMLMKFPAGMANEEEMRRQMNQSLQQQGAGNNNLQEIESETRTITIRGSETNVRIAKVQDSHGKQFRQVTTVFVTEDGSPAMLMLLMPEDDWQAGGEAAAEQMFESLQ